MARDRPKKTMTESELEAIRKYWREVAFREHVPGSLKVLERYEAARGEGRGQTTARWKKTRAGRGGRIVRHG